MKSVIKALENPDLTAKDMHDEWIVNLNQKVLANYRLHLYNT